jgi:hypothetical protein
MYLGLCAVHEVCFEASNKLFDPWPLEDVQGVRAAVSHREQRIARLTKVLKLPALPGRDAVLLVEQVEEH